MTKRKYTMDETKIKRYIEEGRGRGEGKDYKPWIDIHDFPSKGISSRCLGQKTGRVHHMFSNMETAYFHVLDWANDIIDIREQYPILDRERAMKIAEAKGIKYPIYITTKTPEVMTTDFLITVERNNKKIYIARTIKDSRELDKPRVIDKFEIERCYWEENGVDWGIVTEKEINREYASNVEWIFSVDMLNTENGLKSTTLSELFELLAYRMNRNTDVSMQKLLFNLDKEFNYQAGTFLSVLRLMIKERKIEMANMKEVFNIERKVIDLVKVNQIIASKGVSII